MKTQIKLHNCTAKEFRIDGTYTEEKERHEKHFDFTLTYQKTDGLDDDTRITWVDAEPADKLEIEKTIFRQFSQEKKALLKLAELTETENENAKLNAAAPDLLAALKLANEIIDRISEDYSTVAGKHANHTVKEARIISSAIQKAT